jgi:hypothetical protein
MLKIFLYRLARPTDFELGELCIVFANGSIDHQCKNRENGIFIAKSRMPRSAEQINVLEKELRQARILVVRGSTVYLLNDIYLYED